MTTIAQTLAAFRVPQLAHIIYKDVAISPLSTRRESRRVPIPQGQGLSSYPQTLYGFTLTVTRIQRFTAPRNNSQLQLAPNQHHLTLPYIAQPKDPSTLSPFTLLPHVVPQTPLAYNYTRGIAHLGSYPCTRMPTSRQALSLLFHRSQ